MTEISFRTFLSAVLALSVIFYSIGFSHAQDKALKKIYWGVTSLSASQWIPWLAKETKIYEKHGLDVDLVLLRGSGQSSQALIGGSIFAAPVTLVTVINANLGGADLVTVAHTVPGVQSKLMVRPGIRRPEDLKGKRLAVSSFGSLGDFLNRYVIRKYGMESGRDVILVAIGNTPERLGALVSGGVDGADLNYPADAQAQRQGFSLLWDFRQEVTYPSMSVVTRRRHIQQDRDTVMRMVKAHVEGIHFLKANKEVSLKILRKYLKTDDREFLEGSYDIYKIDFISVPYPITQGLQATYEYVAVQRPEVWKHKAEEFMDASFIAELEKTGFMKRLSENQR
ncbi:MAG: ABC transporter substrate-binding protein [Candidatus Binatia bacterium]